LRSPTEEEKDLFKAMHATIDHSLSKYRRGSFLRRLFRFYLRVIMSRLFSDPRSPDRVDHIVSRRVGSKDANR
jgi:hypothetical protein